LIQDGQFKVVSLCKGLNRIDSDLLNLRRSKDAEPDISDSLTVQFDQPHFPDFPEQKTSTQQKRSSYTKAPNASSPKFEVFSILNI
jgi:hypothetical protein